MSNKTNKRIALIYDKDCPACKFYVQLAHIEKNIEDVELIDIKESDNDLVRETQNLGLDLNKGFVLVVDEQFYHGPEAIHHLSLLGNRVSFLSKLNYWIFRSRIRSKILYPILTFCRFLLLKLMGRS